MIQRQGRVLKLGQGHDTGDLKLCQDHGRDNIRHLELGRASRVFLMCPRGRGGSVQAAPRDP